MPPEAALPDSSLAAFHPTSGSPFTMGDPREKPALIRPQRVA
jgi:hypothetical protein